MQMKAICCFIFIHFCFHSLGQTQDESTLIIEALPSSEVISADVDLRTLPKPDFIKHWQKQPSFEIKAFQKAASSLSNTMLNFDGTPYGAVSNPDTSGDVGKRYYIQGTQGEGGTVFNVYEKNGGALVAGPFALDALVDNQFCNNGIGNPVVLYDEDAERWIISERNDAVTTSSTFRELCVYISRTSDPITGGWLLTFVGGEFNLQHKMGVWADTYLVSSHESENTNNRWYALNRTELLAGVNGIKIAFERDRLAGFDQQMLTPIDIDGQQPPPGSPSLLIRHRDDELHDPSNNNATEDYLDLYEVAPNFTTPSASTVVITSIALSEFSSSGPPPRIPQPGGGALDPVETYVMNRSSYRNFDTHESIVGCFTIDINGNDNAAIRWFELRKTQGNPWSLYQEGTIDIDEHHRWLGAIAMDASGNIALTYNVSSDTLFPSLRYIGRLSTDPLGTMTQGEISIVEGSAFSTSERFPQYTSLTVDPQDGCTFWVTGSYSPDNQPATRIATFRFDSCGCTPPATPTDLVADNSTPNQIDLSWSAIAGAESYHVYRNENGCPQAQWNLVASNVTETSYAITSVSSQFTYSYAITAVDEDTSCQSDWSNCVAIEATGNCLFPPDFAGLSSVTNEKQNACALTLNWEAAVDTHCGVNQLRYNIYRSQQENFSPGPDSLYESCVNGLTWTDINVANGETYYYIVRASIQTGTGTDPCNGNEDTNTVMVSGSPTGTEAELFFDDLEGGGNAFTSGPGPEDTGSLLSWVLSTNDAVSGNFSWYTINEAQIKDQLLTLAAPIQVTLPQTYLKFQQRVVTEEGYDGAALEYSTDGGNTWFDILHNNPDRIIEGGYVYQISPGSAGPLRGRMAWSGDLGDWFQVTVALGDFRGKDLLLRWRMGCDESYIEENGGWWLDDFQVIEVEVCEAPGFCLGLSTQFPQWPETFDILDYLPCFE